jgi:pimeloyl-ACP methyl ester carboxylesterase
VARAGAALWHRCRVDVILACEREGSGPPLVLLSGIGMSLAAWKPVRPRLAASRSLILFDLPGFGASDAFSDGVDATMPALTDVVAANLERLGIERPHVAGNSLGGAIALELARRELVASVTAISPAGFWSALDGYFAHASLVATWTLARRMRPLAPRLVTRPRLRRLVFGQMFARPERIAPADALANLETFATGAGFRATLLLTNDYRFPAGDLPVPATIAWGTRDALLLPVQAKRARERLPHARHIALEGCGHVPMSDDPEQVAKVILRGSAAAAAAPARVAAH